jgi:hypothetical protein
VDPVPQQYGSEARTARDLLRRAVGPLVERIEGSLFSRVNPTAVAVLFVYALSAAGAIFVILELSTPFEGHSHPAYRIQSHTLRGRCAAVRWKSTASREMTTHKLQRSCR